MVGADDGTVGAPGPTRTRSAGTRHGVRDRWWFAAVFVAAAVPRLLTAGRFVTTDEPTWIRRTLRFSDAVVERDFSNASASIGEPATMPGVTTMWIGSFARLARNVAERAGLVESTRFDSPDGLAGSQILVALVSSALIGVLFLVVARWAGAPVALVAAGILATEPWIVGHGAVLHTDELTALFGTIGLIVLAHCLGIPDGDRRPRSPRRVAAFAGVMLMSSALTKVVGIGFWSGAAVLVAWALIRQKRESVGHGVVSAGRLGAIAVAAGLALVVASWPALVVDPAFQGERLIASIGLGSEPPNRADFPGGRQFFLGEAVDDPGWLYYPVALALRTTPWVLVAVVVGIPAALWRSSLRRHASVLAVPVAALFLVLSAAPKKYDRYGLVLLVPLAVVAALGIVRLVHARLPRATRPWLGAAAGAAALVVSVAVAPYGLAYFNPALGGSEVGADAVLVGWGEGLEQAAERIEERSGGDCSDVTVSGLGRLSVVGWRCTTPAPPGETPDYVALYVNRLQRYDGERPAIAGRRLVDVVEIRGIRYVEIWE